MTSHICHIFKHNDPGDQGRVRSVGHIQAWFQKFNFLNGDFWGKVRDGLVWALV